LDDFAVTEYGNEKPDDVEPTVAWGSQDDPSLFDDDLQQLAGMTSLKRLNLWRVAMTDSGVAHLADLTNLENLNLDNTQVSDEGLKSLQKMNHLLTLPSSNAS